MLEHFCLLGISYKMSAYNILTQSHFVNHYQKWQSTTSFWGWASVTSMSLRSLWNFLAGKNTGEVSAFMIAHFLWVQECHAQLLLGIWSFQNQFTSTVCLNILFYTPKRIPHPADSRSMLHSNEFPVRNGKTGPAMTIYIFLRCRIWLSPLELWE